MFYYYKWISDNILVHDTHDFNNFKIEKGQHCFIIGHHINDKDKILKVLNSLINFGYTYFNIFGSQANLWGESLLKLLGGNESKVIEFSTIANEEMAYNLAMFSKINPDFNNLVLSDDIYFTDYLVNDVKEIINGRSVFTVYDWHKFREGFEFKHHEKDAIVSIHNGVLIGYLGQEKSYGSIFKAFRDKVFDGKSFYEIWEER